MAGFIRVLALEGVKYGITVNVLAPAALSRMTEDLMPENEETAVRMAPEKVSPTVAWLCTDAAAKVTCRQFCVSSSRTTLLSWQYDVLAERDRLTSLGPSRTLENKSKPAWTAGRNCSSLWRFNFTK